MNRDAWINACLSGNVTRSLRIHDKSLLSNFWFYSDK